MRRTVRWLGMALAIPVLSGAGDGTRADGPAPEADGAGCTITVKARRDPGTGGSEDISIWLRAGRASKVRIKSGTWSPLGDDTAEAAMVTFDPDGTWRQVSPARTGSGEWSGRFTLRMGCRYNRRYQFELHGGVDTVRPQYPSASSFTQSQTINLGNLAQYF